MSGDSQEKVGKDNENEVLGPIVAAVCVLEPVVEAFKGREGIENDSRTDLPAA